MVIEENLSIYMLITETDLKIGNLTSTRQHFPEVLMDRVFCVLENSSCRTEINLSLQTSTSMYYPFRKPSFVIFHLVFSTTDQEGNI